jgi:predicted nuclease of predicted toxin-antitoxin system
MKLLFDQNLSDRLPRRLASLYPGSLHLKDLGMTTDDDLAIWNYAVANGFTIVSKDADFQQRSLVRGHPPKVVWIRLGNCSTAAVDVLLRTRHADLLAFENDPTTSILILS